MAAAATGRLARMAMRPDEKRRAASLVVVGGDANGADPAAERRRCSCQ